MMGVTVKSLVGELDYWRRHYATHMRHQEADKALMACVIYQGKLRRLLEVLGHPEVTDGTV